jgi:hypothetical protein
MVRLVLKPLLVLSLGLIAPYANSASYTAHIDYAMPSSYYYGSQTSTSDTGGYVNQNDYFTNSSVTAYLSDNGFISTRVEGRDNYFNNSVSDINTFNAIASARSDVTVTNNSGDALLLHLKHPRKLCQL